MKKSNKKGFTIVELVIVIAVIAILAAVLIPTFSNVVEKANESKAMQQARIAYENYLADHADKSDLKQNICIKVGKYYFYVTNGQFNADSKKNCEKPTTGNDAYMHVEVSDKAEVFTSTTGEDGSISYTTHNS